jgi:hypothetical protein
MAQRRCRGPQSHNTPMPAGGAFSRNVVQAHAPSQSVPSTASSEVLSAAERRPREVNSTGQPNPFLANLNASRSGATRPAKRFAIARTFIVRSSSLERVARSNPRAAAIIRMLQDHPARAYKKAATFVSRARNFMDVRIAAMTVRTADRSNLLRCDWHSCCHPHGRSARTMGS